ncbi:phosphoribosylglycinamide formyltransferase [Candidatus Peregrinibacteria bacterium]|nr:phosphoribosylglycinamide formyltransferase [Candidatus Peregrinibacteria bacterium]
MNFVVLSSSRGTTFQAIIDALKNTSLEARCLGLISDRDDRGCVTKAKAAGLPVRIVTKKKNEDREDYDRRLHEAILELVPKSYKLPVRPRPGGQATSSTVIAGIGWLYMLSPWFVSTWKNRILNVHPSLLPKHPGLHAHEEVIQAGERESGMTIHVIDEGLDTGPILVQKKCTVSQTDTPETLKAKVQELEKEWYPRVLQMLHTGEMKLP